MSNELPPRLKKGNNVRRQLSKEGAAAAVPPSVQNGAVSLENGDHREEKEGESGEPEKASSQVGGDLETAQLSFLVSFVI